MHFGYVHNLCTTSFFKIIQTNFLICFVSQFLDLTIFAFDKFCELLLKMRIENIAIKSTIDAMLKTGELEEIIENGRIKLRATHQDI